MKTLQATALILYFLGSPTMAGTILTSGLPTGTAIINISGTADGAAAYGGATGSLAVIGVNQDDWYRPFNASNQLLEFTFQPGTYDFRIINQTAAAQLFPSLTSTELNQISSGAWTYNRPWATDYLAFDISAATNQNEHQLFTGAVTPLDPTAPGWIGGGFTDSASAYSEAISKGVYNEIVTGSGRYTGTVQTSYTFSVTQTLIFAVPDYFLPDNNGSVSVLVSRVAPVPLPPTFINTGLGLLSIGLMRLLRKT
jgi:hypothetical protein